MPRPVAVSDEPVVVSTVATVPIDDASTMMDAAPDEYEPAQTVAADRVASAPPTPRRNRRRWITAAAIASVTIFALAAYLRYRGGPDARFSGGGPVVAVGAIFSSRSKTRCIAADRPTICP